MAWKERHGNSWKIRRRIDGKKTTLRIVACSEEEAAAIVGDETNREKEEKIGLRRNSPFLKVGSGPRFSDWAPEYLAWYETAFPRSFRKIVDHFKPLLLHFGHLKIADGQEEGWSEAWASYESDRAVSGSTLASELSTLTTALNRASATGGRKKKTKRWKLVRVSPVAELAFSHDDGEEERHHFSADELEAIYQADPKTLRTGNSSRSQGCVAEKPSHSWASS